MDVRIFKNRNKLMKALKVFDILRQHCSPSVQSLGWTSAPEYLLKRK